MLIFLLLLRIAQFISWRQFIVIGIFEILTIIYNEIGKEDKNEN